MGTRVLFCNSCDSLVYCQYRNSFKKFGNSSLFKKVYELITLKTTGNWNFEMLWFFFVFLGRAGEGGELRFSFQSKVKRKILVKSSLHEVKFNARKVRFNPCRVKFMSHLSDSSLLDIWLFSSHFAILVNYLLKVASRNLYWIISCPSPNAEKLIKFIQHW